MLDKMKDQFIEGATEKGISEGETWKRYGQTGKHLLNMHLINHIPPVMLLLLIKQLI